MTLRTRLILLLVASVVITTLAMGTLSFWQAQSVVVDRLTSSDLPAQLKYIRSEIEGQVNQLQQSARQLATSPFLLRWADNGFPDEDLPLLMERLNELIDQQELVTASWADRETANYWNEAGFLRTLNRQQDAWFYAFRDSGQATSASVFTEDNGDVRLFVNYQMLNGRGLAGLGMPLDQIKRFLNTFKIGDTGLVYLADADGLVKVHRNDALRDDATLESQYGRSAEQTLLDKSDFSVTRSSDGLVASSFIPSLGWYVVADIPQSVISQPVASMRINILILGVVLSIIAALLGIILATTLVRSLSRISNSLRDIGEGDGDLRHRLDATGPLELSTIGQGFNNFIGVIHDLVRQVHTTSQSLNASAREVSESAEHIQSDTQLQTERTTQVATAIEEMGTTVSDVADNAANAASEASAVSSQATNGLTVVDNARAVIQTLAEESTRIANVVGSLAEKSDKIGTILDVIRDISEQTNLLALNAAIESARAGEHGRGFAVVADEVRKLAQRTAQSTDEIQGMIDQLQSESHGAVQAARTGQQQAESGLDSVREATEVLQQIVKRIEIVNDMNHQVATATEEQSTVVRDISQNVNDINQSVETNAETASQLAHAARALHDLSVELDGLVARFQV